MQSEAPSVLYDNLQTGFCQKNLEIIISRFLFCRFVLFVLSPNDICCVCLVYITTRSWKRLLLFVSTHACFSVWRHGRTRGQCLSVCACVQSGLKAFRRVWEKVWNLGMTSLSMMSFLQGDFGTCESLAEVTHSLLTPCNWQWHHGSPLQIEPCKIYKPIMLARKKMCFHTVYFKCCQWHRIIRLHFTINYFR